MFTNKLIEENPRTLVRKNAPHNDFTFEVVELEGTFYRVMPESASEVFFLQTLTKGYNIHVPESGNGIIVNMNTIDLIRSV